MFDSSTICIIYRFSYPPRRCIIATPQPSDSGSTMATSKDESEILDARSRDPDEVLVDDGGDGSNLRVLKLHSSMKRIH